MFQKGNFIIYGRVGVCRIMEIGAPKPSHVFKGKLYYTLSPVYRSETIYVPVETDAHIRSIITRDEAKKVIAQIPEIYGNVCDGSNSRLLSEHYEALLETHHYLDLLRLIKGIVRKDQKLMPESKKLGKIDYHYKKIAEDLLYGEFAVALDISWEDAQKSIENACLEVGY